MRIFIVFLTAFFLSSAPANAQIGDIFEDIFGSGKKYPSYPGAPVPGFGQIDNIPVNIEIQSAASLDDHTLVVSAYAPADAANPNSKERLIGQTRMLMTGLGSPLQLVVAAPEPVTRDIPFARITAEIVDPNNQTVLVGRNDARYAGREPAFIELAGQGSGAPSPSSRVDTVSGDVVFADSQSHLFRGGTLVVELIEDGLAGGPNSAITILGQTRIDVDQKSAPFDFNLDAVMPSQSNGQPLALRAYIEDWAGRRVMETATPTAYAGPGRNYRLRLSPFAGVTVSSGPSPAPSGGPYNIEGQAQFDAHKGLPAGSRLIATVSRGYGTPSQDRTIGRQDIPLDGLSGYIQFNVPLDRTAFEPGHPDPQIDVKILDSRDRVFFDSGLQPLSRGFNTIRLSPTSAY